MVNEESIFKQKTKANFDSTAANYNESSDGKFASSVYDEIIKRVIKEQPRTLLDLGCGNGNILQVLLDKTSIKLSGLDLSDKMIDVAQKRLGNNVELKVGDSEQLPWPENSFDMVICSMSFHHYTQPEKVLKEISRVLKKDGIIILGDPTIPINFIRKLENAMLKWSDGGDYHLYNKEEITSLFSQAGLEAYDWCMPKYQSFVINGRLNR